ncbi:MAG: sulfatase-like hydrolase/transferase, partial [Rhodosalinus sp.]
WRLPAAPPGAAFTARVAAETVNRTLEAHADLAAFRVAAARDPYAGAGPLLDRIGTDVFVVFIESYGRSSLEHPLYAPTHRATLGQAEGRLAGEGLAMRSGWLGAPTAGGRSWLSHLTFATGLPITDQTRHSAALASGRRALFHIAREAGFRTAAVMPAITLAWPESARMGFDEVHDAAALGYAGQPFNWVTMPDQFTLARAEGLFDRGGPWFAQIALISSHAPWVPVPELVPWEAIGDGRIFDRWATEGDPPEVVWRDTDRIRAQYRKAVDYSLRTAMDWAARQAEGSAPLILILGDHPPAGFVALDDTRAVPAHLIGPPELVEQAAGWGWTEGLLPGEGVSVLPMEAMRDRWLAAYSSGGPERQARR